MDGSIGALDFSGCDVLSWASDTDEECVFPPAQIGQCAFLHTLNLGGRGLLHSSTFRLNVSTFCGKGGAFRGRLGGV